MVKNFLLIYTRKSQKKFTNIYFEYFLVVFILDYFGFLLS